MCASSGYAILGVLTEIQHNTSSSCPLDIRRSLCLSNLFIYQYNLPKHLYGGCSPQARLGWELGVLRFC
jgi:hypothetical protein